MHNNICITSYMHYILASIYDSAYYSRVRVCILLSIARNMHTARNIHIYAYTYMLMHTT